MFTLSKRKNIIRLYDLKYNNSYETEKRVHSDKKHKNYKINSTQISFFGKNPLYDIFSSSFEQKMINNFSFKSIFNDKSKNQNTNNYGRTPIKENIGIFKNNTFSHTLSDQKKNKISIPKKKLLIQGKYTKFDLDLFRKKTKNDLDKFYKENNKEKKKTNYIPFRNCLIKSKLRQYYNNIFSQESFNSKFSQYNNLKLFLHNSRNNNTNKKYTHKLFLSLPILPNNGKTIND